MYRDENDTNDSARNSIYVIPQYLYPLPPNLLAFSLSHFFFLAFLLALIIIRNDFDILFIWPI